MVKRMYEGMFLLDSNRYTREPKVVSGQISEMLEKLGGDVVVSRLWSEQRLAYPIRGQRKGAYWLTYFRMDGPQVAKLERESRLNNNVLRSLIVSVDERLADALVQHAGSGDTTTATPETKEGGSKEEVKAAETPADKAAETPADKAAGSSEEKTPAPTEEKAADSEQATATDQ